ncbi:unnamed protein product [Parascedosporium putredinis]|uniref:Decapping nuclease n=1 Tax=Parascedosporium putredinis TaxID=1442378 RepID=A0A9P1GUA6_9PEZI|nr:unnamed protein product [Parascedosporium putredinis]CAI7987468.1 unnamed protein product [Parascedosporium putredinis]
MTARYPIRSGGFRPGGGRKLVARPQFKQDASSVRWYYHNPMDIGADLSAGFDRFDKHDESQPDHLTSLLKTIIDWEKREERRLDAHLVTWRGMMTKILSCPFENRDGIAWYKFETLCTLSRPWGEISRTEIESRPNDVVSNKAQYCSVAITNLGPTKMCLAGEIDALWGSKPSDPQAPIDWVELKTTAEIQSERDRDFFNNKVMRFWIQSFLIGVSRVIVGFRSHDGHLVRVQEMYTADLLRRAPELGRRRLKSVIRGGGLWRIRRQPGGRDVEVFRLAEHGHGQVLSDEFLEWRNSEAMKAIDQQAQQRALQAEKERQEQQEEARAAGQQQPS